MNSQSGLFFVDLVIEARYVCPIVPKNTLLEHQAIVINAGKVIDICPNAIWQEKYQARERVRLADHILIPGLINLHTHAGMNMMRGIADDLALMPWLQNHIWPAEKNILSAQYVQDATLLACAEMLSGGITCFNDMYFYPEAAAAAATQAGIRSNLGLVVLEFASSYANDADDYLQKGFAAHDSWRDNPLISTCIAPHAPYTISDKTFQQIVTYAEQLGLGIHTHLHETKSEITQSESRYGLRPLQRLAQLDVLGPNFIAAHGVHLLHSEMDLLAEHSCHIAHCPCSNLKLASGIAPVAELLARGVNVALGTDSVASNNRLDIFAEMRLAALLAKGFGEDATLLPAHQVLEMATINAAKALGLEDKIGSIEIGKMADLTAIKLNDLVTMPCYEPISQLLYACGREQVTHTWVAGDLRYTQQTYANIEHLELKEIIHRWQAKLWQYKH